MLLALTAAGGLLRFTWLGRPPLWGDEALVYWRTCGTYAQMLGPLHADGFPPLHYELAWVIGHLLGHPPGPAVLRLVPATCGTLLVPAVYLLARQLLGRRPSLTAAAFTAFGAFGLFYSRDAKMYAEAWLAMTVGVAALLAWARTGRVTAWLGWVAAAAAAAGFQTLTLVPAVGLSPLVLLTQRRVHWRQSLLWLAGVVLIGAGPAGHYLKFSSWVDTVDARGWRASGLAWVEAYNYGRTGPQQARYLATTFLTGWEWPRPIAFQFMPDLRGVTLRWVATAVIGCVLAGAVPWPRAWRDRAIAGPVVRWFWRCCRGSIHVARHVVGRSPGAIVAAVPEARGLRRDTGKLGSEGTPGNRGLRAYPQTPACLAATDSVESPWRAALWLAAWVVLPVYVFYCRSVPGFVTPLGMLTAVVGGIGHPVLWAAAVSVAFVGLLACQPVRASMRYVGAVAAVVAVIGGCQLAAPAMAAAARAAIDGGHPWHSVWVPRYLGFVWPAVAIVAGALLSRLPTVALRRVALGLVLAANLGMFAFRLFGSTEPPVDRMAADAWAAQPRDGRPADTLAWFDLGPPGGGNGGGNLLGDPGRYYLQLLARRPMSPTLFKDSLDAFTLHLDDTGGLADAVVAGPALVRVIVWEQFQANDPRPAPDDLLPGWHVTADEWVKVRDVWTGQDLCQYRRRQFGRT